MSSATAAPAAAQAAAPAAKTTSARLDVIRMLAKAQGLCPNCLQKKHAGDRKERGLCARPRANPEEKLGASFVTALEAHKVASGKAF